MTSRRFNLSSLLAFVAISEQGSINKAAQVLNVSQPAVSRGIRTLEEMLGVELLERSSVGVQLTPHGEAVLRHAKSIDAELRQCLEDFQELEKTGRNRVSVGGTPMVVSHILAEAVQRTLGVNAEITVNLIEGTSTNLLDELQGGQLDIALVPLGTGHFEREIDFRPIFSDQFAVVVGAHNPLADAGATTLRALEDELWILPGRQFELRHQIEREWATMGGRIPRAIIETTSYLAVDHLLGATNAVALLSAAFFREQIASGRFVTLSGDWHFVPRTFFLCTRISATLSPAAELVRQQILSVSEIVKRGNFDVAVPGASARYSENT